MSKVNEALPEWLERVRDDLRSKPALPPPDQPEWPIMPEPGEIRAARALEGSSSLSRLILVLSKDPLKGVVSVALTTSDVDVATDMDVRLPSAYTHLSFPLIVETDVVSPLWYVQLGPAIARLSPDLTAALSELPEALSTSGSPENPSLTHPPALIRDEWRGLPTRDSSEPLWQWKKKELAEMRILASDCLSSLLEAQDPTFLLDPEILLASVRSTDQWSGPQRVIALLQWWRKNNAHIPSECLQPIFALSEVSKVQAWRDNEFGLLMWNALQPFREQLLRDNYIPPFVQPADAICRPPRKAVVRDDVSASVFSICRKKGIRSVRMATSREFWDSPSMEGAFAVDIAAGERLQIIPDPIDDVKLEGIL